MDSCAYVIFHSYQCTQTLSFTFRAAKGHVPSALFDTVTSLSPQRWCAQRHPFRWCRCSSSSQPSSSVTSDTSDPSAPSWPLCPASSSSSQVGAITHVPLSLVPDSVTDHRCLVCPVSHVDTRGHTLHHGTISSVWGRCVCTLLSGKAILLDFTIRTRLFSECLRIWLKKMWKNNIQWTSFFFNGIFWNKCNLPCWTAGGCNAPRAKTVRSQTGAPVLQRLFRLICLRRKQRCRAQRSIKHSLIRRLPLATAATCW